MHFDVNSGMSTKGAKTSQPRATPWESDPITSQPCKGETTDASLSGLGRFLTVQPRALPWAGLSPGLWPCMAVNDKSA